VKNLDLRPLSVGEILDRTFTLYRTHFLLFLGICAVPQILLLALNLSQVFIGTPAIPGKQGANAAVAHLSTGMGVTAVILGILGLIVWLIVYLFSQGATVTAVSELYLGRTITISDSFRRVRGEVGNLFGVIMLNGLATGAAFILLIIPGIYVMCRLAVCIPAALIENLGPRTSLERSWELTKDNAGRAFLIILLYFALSFAAAALFAVPFQIMMVLSAAKSHPEAMRMWMAFMQVGSTIATVLVTPVLTIASAILYYDLRVRKEAFDLQMMMNPLGGASPVPSSVPSVLS
jgi:membrane-anchored glycerophosphoryl diester phosphodiesterase (GDPDase)